MNGASGVLGCLKAVVSMAPTVLIEIITTVQQMSMLTRSTHIHGDSSRQGRCLGYEPAP
jgi:hypothetical protein